MLMPRAATAEISARCPGVLSAFNASPERWAAGSGYWSVAGSAEELIVLVRRIGQRRLKRLRLAERSG